MGEIYLELTNRFNEEKMRAILSSEQAIVMHGLALSSKDGGWIAREDTALDAERRELLFADEKRSESYAFAAQEWTRNWPALKREIAGLPLRQAHQLVVERAQILPQQVL